MGEDIESEVADILASARAVLERAADEREWDGVRCAVAAIERVLGMLGG